MTDETEPRRKIELNFAPNVDEEDAGWHAQDAARSQAVDAARCAEGRRMKKVALAWVLIALGAAIAWLVISYQGAS